MNPRESVTAFAPISSGNFIIGFDMLGACLQPADGTPLGDFVRISPAVENKIIVTGPFVGQLPADPADNIVSACLARYNEALAEKAIPSQTVELTLYKCLPVGSGLGSSAASVVAAFAALNLFYREPLSARELLRLCGELEGRISGSVHYDNVAPCLLGGLQLMSLDAELCHALPAPDWHYVLFHPGTQLSTREARAVLPSQYSRHDALLFGQKLANFVAALHAGRSDAAAHLLQDHLIEPYRAHLIPLFHEAKQCAQNNGALAYSISGAGPTSISVCRTAADAAQVQMKLRELYADYPEQRAWICRLDTRGAREFTAPIPL